MRVKPLEYVVQGFLSVENDAGEAVDKIELEARTFPAGVAAGAFEAHRADVERLALEKTAELTPPNRAARRAGARKGGTKQ